MLKVIRRQGEFWAYANDVYLWRHSDAQILKSTLMREWGWDWNGDFTE